LIACLPKGRISSQLVYHSLRHFDAISGEKAVAQLACGARYTGELTLYLKSHDLHLKGSEARHLAGI
jgi:hypothetical protein